MKSDALLIFEKSKAGRRAYSLPQLDVPLSSSFKPLKEGPLRKEDDIIQTAADENPAIIKSVSTNENPEIIKSVSIPEQFLRKYDAALPEASEPEVVRHYTRLSQKNYGLDSGFYPLGSCTMKYNPKVNENVSRLDGFVKIHPYQCEDTVQGCLKLMYSLEKMLCMITGMDKFTLQPSAGAHGEMTGLMIIKAYHEQNGHFKRRKIIIPDSAHGTNPASAVVAGFETIGVASGNDGCVDKDMLKGILNDETAGLMLTNPNTLGLFEVNIKEIADMVHENGGLLYYDGANANAICGVTRPGDMGFDVVHLNLHKTFSTPHGGGGPGSGPVGVVKKLAAYLPVPSIEYDEKQDFYFYDKTDCNEKHDQYCSDNTDCNEKHDQYCSDKTDCNEKHDQYCSDKTDCNEKRDQYCSDKTDRKTLSIGRVRSFYGNFLVAVRAYSYILSLGFEGLKKVSETAVLNANYLMKKIKDYYVLPYDRICMHEFVLSAVKQKQNDITALDIAKRLLDYGYHPPTIYFPLIVKEAIMIEPTETESLETLDQFAETMIEIAKDADNNSAIIKGAPYNTPVLRLDETNAAKCPVLRADIKGCEL